MLLALSQPSLESTTPKKRKKKSLKTFVRIGLSLILASVVYLTVDRAGLMRALGSLSWQGAVTITTLYILGQVLSAMKWRVFVDGVGISRTPYEILRAYFFGMFVNVYGFGTVGGDVARALMLNPEKGKRVGALATVVADRVQGLFVLLGIGAVCILAIRPEALGKTALLLGLGSAAGLVALLVGWWFGPRILQLVFPAHHQWGDSARRITDAFPRRAKPLLTVSFISFLFHNVQILMHLVIAWELKASPLSLALIYATVPFVNIVASLPVSIMNGLGVREAMYCFLFIPLGVPQEIAVAFGAIWLFTVTLVSSVGILLMTPGSKGLVDDASLEELESGDDSTQSSVAAKRAAG